jgi:hypothetical protein
VLVLDSQKEGVVAATTPLSLATDASPFAQHTSKYSSNYRTRITFLLRPRLALYAHHLEMAECRLRQHDLQQLYFEVEYCTMHFELYTDMHQDSTSGVPPSASTVFRLQRGAVEGAEHPLADTTRRCDLLGVQWDDTI